MRLIPVLDLKDGYVVHAVAGQRDKYRPLESILVGTAEPLPVLLGLHERLGCDEFYLADLNAILGQSRDETTIRLLARQPGIGLLVDSGTTTADEAQSLLALGVSQIIVGTETLIGWEALDEVLQAVPRHRLIFSVDMREGQIISRSRQLANLNPLDVLGILEKEGLYQVILLDLARVGTRRGVEMQLLAWARRRYPDLTLIAGGGIRNLAELSALRSLGIDGALLATALHRGEITPRELRHFLD